MVTVVKLNLAISVDTPMGQYRGNLRKQRVRRDYTRDFYRDYGIIDIMPNITMYRRNYQSSEKYLAWRRAYRKRIGNADSHKYEKTLSGFLMRKYRNMESRIKGIQKQKFHIYGGKSLLSRKSFYQWAYGQRKLRQLFRKWKDSNYERKLCPTVNRIDASRGYEIDNMEWLTHSENSRLTSRLKKKI